MMKAKKYSIAVIAGDGIGREVMPEGLRVLEAVARKEGVHCESDHFPWGCDYYRHTGKMMPDDGLDQIRHQPFWDERFEEISKRYPEVKTDKYHIDILTAHFVLHPDWF